MKYEIIPNDLEKAKELMAAFAEKYKEELEAKAEEVAQKLKNLPIPLNAEMVRAQILSMGEIFWWEEEGKIMVAFPIKLGRLQRLFFRKHLKKIKEGLESFFKENGIEAKVKEVKE